MIQKVKEAREYARIMYEILVDMPAYVGDIDDRLINVPEWMEHPYSDDDLQE